jgi:hypothetical protein
VLHARLLAVLFQQQLLLVQVPYRKLNHPLSFLLVEFSSSPKTEI